MSVTNQPITFRITSLVLEQSSGCPSSSKMMVNYEVLAAVTDSLNRLVY